MMYLEQNIKGLCIKFGIEFNSFMDDLDVDNVHELTIYDLQAVCEEYNVDLLGLMFMPMFRKELWSKKADQIKLLILDVDGVMTDGGMYITENGDQIKKFNTKDGMAIQFLKKNNIEPAIISNGFKAEMVKTRAAMLGIDKCYVGRDKKIDILATYCQELGIELANVAIVGDDINDLEIIQKVGFSACPSDAVNAVKSKVDVILSTKGGQGCVREFIDAYLLKNPVSY